MFVDLSGFTRMTEQLMRLGTEGAEELSLILNRIFEPLVSIVYERGGFVPHFAGDSFIAIFEYDGSRDMAYAAATRIREAASSILNGFRLQGVRESWRDQYQIGIKIGISEGEIEWGIVGDQRKAFYFRGEPIDLCAEAQNYAQGLQIVCCHRYARFADEIGPQVAPGFYETPVLATVHQPDPKLRINLPQPDLEIMRHFLPDEVLATSEAGEFRSVVTVFLSFEGVATHEAMAYFAQVVLEQTRNFGAYFKEIDFGDKGGVMVCFFGAPTAFENNAERALEFALALREELANLETLTGARFRIGITSGQAFTGVIGGRERCQYAAAGARVNLAARLMSNSAWGEVRVDDNMQRNRNFKFHYSGKIRYKGFEDPLPTFLLTGRNITGKAGFGGEYVGRQEEQRHLLAFAQPLTQGRFAGVAYIFGEAGIGKSRFCFEFLRALRDAGAVTGLTCQSDQILRKPFNPFIYLLKNYFEQSPENTPTRNQELFEQNFLELIYDLSECAHPDADAVRKEIKRTQSVLAALVGLAVEEKALWSQLDARGRYQNAMAAMANLLIAEALLQPTVIEIEDAHWYDDMSREFLNQFIRRAKSYPLMLLISSRYEDDGARNYILRPGLLDELGIRHTEIDLNFLNPEDIRLFAESRLGGRLHDDLFELLQRMTQGNPFYIDQMVEYFKEAGMLQQDNDCFTLKDGAIQLSDSVKQVMMARIDRLSGLVKETVKAAAVIGREFELPVLSEVMARQEEFIRKNGNLDTVVREQVQTAEKWQIWHAMNELRYIFRHSLLREAAYDMQLGARLRELHQLIAEAIEKLYPDSEERYVDLAFHYEEAENIAKTHKYLEKAADYARRNFQNRQALKFYDKLIGSLTGNASPKDRKITKLMLRKGALLELTGQWAEAEAIFRETLSRAVAQNSPYLIGRSNRRLGQLLMMRGDYEQARMHLDRAVVHYEKANDPIGLAKTYGNLGALYFRQGAYEQAKNWFAKAIEINRAHNRETENASIVANMGLIYMNQGHYDEGIRRLEEQLSLTERAQDKPGLATLYTNLGIIFLEKNSLDSALICLEKGLARSEELGNKLLMTICIGSIGSVWEKKGDYPKAMQNFERDLDLCNELGDKQGIAIACGLMGDLLSLMGDFDRSNSFLEKQYALSRELNYKKGVAKALNTLGDNFFFKGDYAHSHDYYNQAIACSRELGNKLILGYSLIEKGSVHAHAGEAAQARLLLEEGRDIALALGNSDLAFGANILRAQILILENAHQEAVRHLQQMLLTARNEREEAAVHFELRRVADNPIPHHLRALTLYRSLYEKTPQYLFKRRIQILEEESL